MGADEQGRRFGGVGSLGNSVVTLRRMRSLIAEKGGLDAQERVKVWMRERVS